MLLTRPKPVTFHLESLDLNAEDVKGKRLADEDVLLSVALVRVPERGLKSSQRMVGGGERGHCNVRKSRSTADYTGRGQEPQEGGRSLTCGIGKSHVQLDFL